MSVTYTATLPVRDQTVLYISSLLHAERLRRGTRTDTRALSTFNQAVLILRWFLDSTRIAQLAVDNAISKSTVYDYLDEGFTVLAAQAPAWESALLAAKMAGHDHISIDGTLTGDRPVPHPWPHPGGRSVVVGQTPQPRREHPSDHRPGRLAFVDFPGTSRP